MSPGTLQQEIEQAVPRLLHLAGELSWNIVSGNCKFILSEIKDCEENFHVQRILRKRENDKKAPVVLSELMPTLQDLCSSLYDINLLIYKAGRDLTIIEIQYYPKSSLHEEYRQAVLHHSPMLHCKVAHPPWLMDERKKFDINWEHRPWLIKWKMFLARQKLSARTIHKANS